MRRKLARIQSPTKTIANKGFRPRRSPRRTREAIAGRFPATGACSWRMASCRHRPGEGDCLSSRTGDRLVQIEDGAGHRCPRRQLRGKDVVGRWLLCDREQFLRCILVGSVLLPMLLLEVAQDANLIRRGPP